MRYLTAGESHGEGLYGIIEGLPAGLKIDTLFIDEMLKRRQCVYGRGPRAQTVPDKAQIKSGVHNLVSTGAPITVVVDNGNCGKVGDFDFYRPGHADFAANQKYDYGNTAIGAERASARETAMRTALGAICMQILNRLGITVTAFVTQVGGVKAAEQITKIDQSVRCDTSSAAAIKAEIDKAEQRGDTLGGKIKIVISGIKAGIGSHVYYARRLDYILGGAFMSIPSVKAVELGLGTEFAFSCGKEAADCLKNIDGQIVRLSNNGGGIEGGISNGEDIVFTLTLKPIPSVAGLQTVDINGNNCNTGKVRGDVTAVIAACTVAESVAALELTAAILDCFGGDTMDELEQRYDAKGKI